MLMFGLSVAMIGLGVVFGALVFLVFVINAITAVSRMVDKKPEAALKKPEAAVQQVSAVAAAAEENESDVLAVISAAIAYLSQGTMAVKTITRINAAPVPAWSGTGRQETMNLRQV